MNNDIIRTTEVKREVIETVPEETVVVVERRRRFGPSHVVFYLVDIVEVLLALRFLFKLLSANGSNVIVAFVYQITAPLIRPFVGMFPELEKTFFDWPTLVAMLVYALVGYAIVKVLSRAK